MQFASLRYSDKARPTAVALVQKKAVKELCGTFPEFCRPEAEFFEKRLRQTDNAETLAWTAGQPSHLERLECWEQSSLPC